MKDISEPEVADASQPASDPNGSDDLDYYNPSDNSTDNFQNATASGVGNTTINNYYGPSYRNPGFNNGFNNNFYWNSWGGWGMSFGYNWGYGYGGYYNPWGYDPFFYNLYLDGAITAMASDAPGGQAMPSDRASDITLTGQVITTAIMPVATVAITTGAIFPMCAM
ncbi:MAG: hypothetical protein U5L96_10110 [Owenweeksia sp.]|nr:hypothetical protein [Owenweeksia sp.]